MCVNGWQNKGKKHGMGLDFIQNNIKESEESHNPPSSYDIWDINKGKSEWMIE